MKLLKIRLLKGDKRLSLEAPSKLILFFTGIRLWVWERSLTELEFMLKRLDEKSRSLDIFRLNGECKVDAESEACRGTLQWEKVNTKSLSL